MMEIDPNIEMATIDAAATYMEIKEIAKELGLADMAIGMLYGSFSAGCIYRGVKIEMTKFREYAKAMAGRL